MKAVETQTQFEKELWHDGKHAMLFNLDDHVVISIIKKCIDNRGMDKNCRMENLKDNLIPISEINSFMEYITRYNSNVMEECFYALVSVSKNHKIAFDACANIYVANRSKVHDKRVERLKEMMQECGILDYMEQFNKCMERILNHGSNNDK